MLRAVYVRTLKDGVTDDQYVEAWMPEGATRDGYPARVSIAHSTVDERETATIFEFEGDPEHVLDALGGLVRPDWRDRVAAVVHDTDVETIFVETLTFGSAEDPGATQD